MEFKKVFEKPEIEVITLNVRDVITCSTEAASYSTVHDYDMKSIWDVFNIGV